MRRLHEQRYSGREKNINLIQREEIDEKDDKSKWVCGCRNKMRLKRSVGMFEVQKFGASF